MKTKIFVILLVMASLLLSGCTGNNQEDSGIEVSDEATAGITEPQDHLVRMEYYEVMLPSTLNISRGDSVAWWNYKQQGSFILVSDDGLFEEKELLFRNSYSYTFNETGTYRFHAKDLPHMNMTVNVI